MSDTPILSGRGVGKTYNLGSNQLQVLKNVDIDVYKGDDCCIVGGSGAGKSTLLHMLGGLDRPSSGQVYFKGESLLKKVDESLAKFRNKSIGFVFQFHHLLHEFTALENVAMPAKIAGHSGKKVNARAEGLLVELGIGGRLRHYPSQMSGGEQQRVAIARSLMMSPEVLLADEPTGNLDSENASKIQDLFFELKESLGLTLLVVTHDQQFSNRFTNIKTLKDGQWCE